MIAAFVFASIHAVLNRSAPQPRPKYSPGWVYPANESRIVRFVSETVVPGHSDIFVPFQTSGFIILRKGGFSISMAGITGTELLEYEDGLLKKTKTGLTNDQSSVSTDFAGALASSLNDVACEGVGDICRELLSTSPNAINTVMRGKDSRGDSFEAVIGTGRGALLKYTLHRLSKVPGWEHRTVCTFYVLVN